MSTMELRAEFLQSINPLFESDRLMREALDFIKSLLSREQKAQAADAQHDSDEKIEAGLRQAFKELNDYKDGKIKLQSAEDFLTEWEVD